MLLGYPIACETVQFCAPRRFSFPEDTRHVPIREWLCSGPGFRTRRILPGVLHEQKALILRGNLRVSLCKLQILKDLLLYGGPGRDRTDDLFHAMEARSQLRHRPTNLRDATPLLSLLWPDSSNHWELSGSETRVGGGGGNEPLPTGAKDRFYGLSWANLVTKECPLS